MCQRNWTKYNQSLVQRGSLSFFCDPALIKLLQQKSSAKKVGRPPYPQPLIFALILLKISYGLTYRSCEGMAISLFSPHGIKIPSYITLCRRMRQFSNHLPKLSSRRPNTMLIDASGFKVLGEGEWKTKVHGKAYRRKWVKVHILVDSESNEIIDLLVDNPDVGDLTAGLDLLDRVPKSCKKILGDGAYDGQRFRKKGQNLGIEILAPPPKTAKIHHNKSYTHRNDAVLLISILGGDPLARKIWGKLVGYSKRAKVESAFARLKRLFGEGVFSLNLNAQRVELWLKALVSNMWLNWGK